MNDYLIIAKEIAIAAHSGQLYGERDYIEAHIKPVVALIARMGYGQEYQATGWLHDVFEDSDITPQEVIEKGVPPEIVKAAELLTRHKDVPHKGYLAAITTDPLAIVGKFADSSMNFSSTVLEPSTTSAHFQKKFLEYGHNIAVLEPLLPTIR